jgi:hypothetical protein
MGEKRILKEAVLINFMAQRSIHQNTVRKEKKTKPPNKNSCLQKLTAFWDITPTRIHSAVSQKAVIFILVAVRT